MPFQAIESQRMYQQIAGQIGTMIRDGEYKAGDRLPPERDLARAFGVSRNVVREAMVALELAGLIEVRVGAGTFVLSSTADSSYEFAGLSGGDPGPGPFDLLSARHLIEGEIAAQAAANATQKNLPPILETVERMESETLPYRAGRHWDRLFHARVAESTQNAMLVSVVDFLWQRKHDPLFETMNAHVLKPNHRINAAAHRRIYEAIAAGDARAARAAMHAHIEHAELLLSKPENLAGVGNGRG